MARQQISLKQLAINKDNTAIIIVVAIASFLIVFSLVASQALLKQKGYQSKVIGKKKVALNQLKSNAEEVEKLETSYQAFASSEQNVLGGNARGAGDKDGENPRVVLDALPSVYDFPGLTSSLEKVFKPHGLTSITGTDDEVAQAAVEVSSTPQPVEVPFTLTVKGNTQSSKSALQLLERSIRPLQVQKLKIASESNQVELTVTGKTYFQPKKIFDVRTEVVK